MPATKPEIVVVTPVPDIAPGLIVQVPIAGKPFKITLPVANAHVGCVITPTTGVVGVTGCALITMFADNTDVHPTALVTV